MASMAEVGEQRCRPTRNAEKAGGNQKIRTERHRHTRLEVETRGEREREIAKTMKTAVLEDIEVESDGNAEGRKEAGERGD